MRNYRGDVVWIDEDMRGVIRETDGARAKVQIGADWTWLPLADLSWDGDVIVRLPRTGRGWRKLGKLILHNGS